MRIFKRILSCFLMFMLCLTVLPDITVNADTTTVDLVANSYSGGADSIPGGVSYARTGFLCYLLTADGNAVSGTQAYAFKCPGFNQISGGCMFNANSRKGGYHVSSFRGTAPWGMSPFNGDQSSNGDAIRDWFRQTDADGVANGSKFVKYYWGTSNAQKVESGDYILVVETLMHFQYRVKYRYNPSWSVNDFVIAIQDATEEARGRRPPAIACQRQAEYYHNSAVNDYTYWALVGYPIIGTVTDCIEYCESVRVAFANAKPFISVSSGNPFALYLNKVACFAERVGAGGAGQNAGFQPWTGSISSQLSNSDVERYGVGMFVVSALDDGVIPPSIPDPGLPTPPTTDFDGTLYTLTSAGGSSSSGGVPTTDIVNNVDTVLMIK